MTLAAISSAIKGMSGALTVIPFPMSKNWAVWAAHLYCAGLCRDVKCAAIPGAPAGGEQVWMTAIWLWLLT